MPPPNKGVYASVTPAQRAWLIANSDTLTTGELASLSKVPYDHVRSIIRTHRKSVPLGELITEPEMRDLVGYLNKQKVGSMHQNIIDWLGHHNLVLDRMTRHGFLLSYFAYLLEYTLTARGLANAEVRQPNL